MKKLGLCISFLTAITACTKKEAAAPVSRHDVIMADPQKQKVRSDGFCDVRFESGKGPAFAWPALAAAPASGLNTPRWINVWATWCKPCIEEMPLLVKWRPVLSKKNMKIDFLSVDKSEADVQRFLQSHAELRGTVRIQDLQLLPAWLKSVGLDEHATIPVHVLTDPQGRVICGRAGGVEEKDWPVITAHLGSGYH